MLAVTDLTVIENHARIPDTRVCEALGFGDIQHLHKLIGRHFDELATYGGIYGQTVPKMGRGRPSKSYMLTEEQAVLICMFARTEKSPDARRMIVDVFMRWKRGQAMPSAPSENMTIPKDDYIALLTDHNTLLVDHNDLLKQIISPPRKPRRPSIPLTTAEKAKIISMCASGMGVNEIARQTGRSTATISLLKNGFSIINGGNA